LTTQPFLTTLVVGMPSLCLSASVLWRLHSAWRKSSAPHAITDVLIEKANKKPLADTADMALSAVSQKPGVLRHSDASRPESARTNAFRVASQFVGD
jgi:hypothetical protein